jgi:hypothetical protein
MTRRATGPKFVPQRNFFEFSEPGCLWPHGHPDDSEFHFCGARPLAGKPYCADHAAIAYVRVALRPMNARISATNTTRSCNMRWKALGREPNADDVEAVTWGVYQRSAG